MTVICDTCHEEKAKSQMHTSGVNGGPAVCKACHRTSHDMDEFGALRVIVQILERRDVTERHRIVRNLIARYAI